MTRPPRKLAKVLLTGDFQTPEFQAAVAWLRARADVHSCPRIHDAVEHLRQLSVDPLLLVVAQSYPGQYSAPEIERLHRQTPLSRIVAILGSWCEGESRSGRPWPGAMRIYWHQFESRMSPLLEDSPDFISLANLPRTSSIAEQLSNSHGRADGEYRGLVAIRTPTYGDYDALGEALGQIGYSNVWLNKVGWRDLRRATVIIWDGGHGDWSNPSHLAEIGDLSKSAPIIAVMNFPRHDDVALLQKSGVSAVVSRPFLTDDLQYQINRLAKTAGVSRQVA